MSSRTREQLIESLAGDVMLADPHDLQAVSGILQRLAELEGAAGDDAVGGFIARLAAGCRELAEEMIVQPPDEAAASLECLAAGVACLQRALSDGVETASRDLPAELKLEDEADDGASVETLAQAPADDEIMREFLESQGLALEELEEQILLLEKNGPADGVVDKIKRRIHTLKGEAGMLGLDTIQHVCHDVETCMESSAGGSMVDCLLKLKDWLASSMESLGEGEEAPCAPAELKSLIAGALAGGGNDTEAGDRGQSGDEGEETHLPREIQVGEEDEPLFWDFIQESRGHLDNADVQLLNIENDACDQESLNSLFRSFHTIKGVAGFLDLMEIKDLAHVAEDALDRARKGRLNLGGQAIDLVFEAVDTLRRMVNEVESQVSRGGPVVTDPAIYGLVDRFTKLLNGASVGQAESAPREVVSPDKRLGEILVDEGKLDADRLREMLDSKGETRLGEALVAGGVVEAKDVSHALRAQKTARTTVNEPAARVKESVKIDTDRLDKLLDAIGELVIAESMVGQNEEILGAVSQEAARNLSHLHKITRVVQELGMGMRMVPVRPTFQKMARLVRDLARKSGKQVEFVTDGEETELDRSVVEKIGDPLIHIIRNSVDHGLEDDVDQRTAAGKPAAGRLELRAFHRGGSIHIEVEDDGRGLDRDAILAKAVERGVVAEGAELSDREIYNLVFMPGFSTAKKVTDISGRGVGMDVVRRNVESLRGTIELNSEPGKGTVVSMRLPLTLAIIDGMIIRVGGDRYIIPTLSVVESLRPTADILKTVAGCGEMLNMRGELLPLFRVEKVFGVAGALTEATECLAIIVEDQGRRMALLVDDLIGQHQVVIKSLGGALRKVDGISGGAIMADGNVGLILDIHGLVKITCGELTGRAAGAA